MYIYVHIYTYTYTNIYTYIYMYTYMQHVNEVRNLLGVEERRDLNEGVPSRRKGFLARQEQRRQIMLQIGKRHYRKQVFLF